MDTLTKFKRNDSAKSEKLSLICLAFTEARIPDTEAIDPACAIETQNFGNIRDE